MIHIWLDTALLAQITHAGNASMMCPNECSNHNATPGLGHNATNTHAAVSVPVALTSTVPELMQLYQHTFVIANALHIQHDQDKRWLICNPTGSGKLAVLDEPAFALLQRFTLPRTLQEVCEEATIEPLRVARAVSLLTELDFLQDLTARAASTQATSHSLQDDKQMLAVWLHVTNACNLRCHYCYVAKDSEHMAEDTMRRSVDAVIRSALLNGYQGIHLTYAGGEATLRLPQVIATHDYALQQTEIHGLTLVAGMISNGAAFPVRMIEQLKERHINVALSLDGIAADHDQQRPLINGAGSFALVDRTITRLLQHGLVPSINVTVTQRNLARLPELLGYILARDLPFGLSYYRDNDCSSRLTDLQFSDTQMIQGMHAAFTYIEKHLPASTLLDALVDKTKMYGSRTYHCGVGRDYLAINQRGGIASCQMEIANPLTTIAAENPLRVIRAERRGVQAVAVQEKEGCRDCEWRNWCSGGCAMLTYRMTGRSDIKSPNCAIYKALFPAALRLEALRLLKYVSPIEI
ncbi:radical SAM/SPASM domain-containing protein [Dictyobacter arantiisoli]|uniref:Radical SAM core domain-containing protein n=1 Tax=Dictyobacter arantiisoli TaxID=2014874 RepID=A0A5A5TA92_9CHLR|nr:radical SAM protein [Dictyobacter arantiisoli]GCF08430.1 hypothetical protein KDI_19940 [Dictyobacter arantiisoli]